MDLLKSWSYGGMMMEYLQQSSTSETININKKNLDEVAILVEDLVINKVRIEKIRNEISDLSHLKILDQELRIISNIQESIKKVSMLRIDALKASIEGCVQQYCSDYKMLVDLKLEGMETEIENTFIRYIHTVILQFIKHMFENNLINSTNESKEIKMIATSDSKKNTLLIESNGKCLNEEEILRFFNKKENIDIVSLREDEINQFLDRIHFIDERDTFIKLCSELKHIGGSIKFESKLDDFMRIMIELPLISSIMRGMLVHIGDQIYAIPSDFIETIISVESVIQQEAYQAGKIIYMEQVILLVDLSELLGIKSLNKPMSIIIAQSDNRRIAFLVDSIIDQTDMVIKPKHSIIKDVKEIKGSTILGDGLVTLVLDIPSIINEV